MQTIQHSLIWKEWHEHKWKLVSILAILWTPVTYLAFKEQGDPDLLVVVMLFCIAPLATFVGLGTAASEQSHGTLDFVQALPVPTRQLAMYKLLFGLFTVTLPIFLTLALVGFWAVLQSWLGVQHETLLAKFSSITRIGFTGNACVDVALLTLAAAISLYIWSSALGVNRKDEVSAGAVALGIMVGCWIVPIALWSVLLLSSTAPDVARVVAIGLGAAPAGATALLTDVRWPEAARWFGLFAAFAVHAGLAVWYVRRFGQVTERRYSPRAEVAEPLIFDWQLTPWRKPLTAIIWKQVRESGPLVLLGVAGICGTSLVVALIAASTSTLQLRDIVQILIQILIVVSYVIGLIVAVVVGIGVCLYDVGPQGNAFWRSRPIQPDVWFCTKFLTGVSVLMMAIFLPLLMIYVFATASVSSQPNIQDSLIILPAMLLAFFAAAVAMTCLARHAVYAAILSLPAAYVGIVLVSQTLRAAERLGWLTRGTNIEWQSSGRAVAIGLLLSFAINTAVAWLAFRFDWGRKGRN